MEATRSFRKYGLEKKPLFFVRLRHHFRRPKAAPITEVISHLITPYDLKSAVVLLCKVKLHSMLKAGRVT